MRAVLCREYGGPGDLVLDDIPAQEPGPGQVRLAIHAAGLNFADILMIAGKYQEKPDFPFSPGLEAAGVIDAVGDGVTRVQSGDRVMGLLGHGAYAESAVTDEQRVFKIPDSMDFPAAAAFPVAYGTSHIALEDRARLRQGETLVVHGAAGGVGLTAVQIGKVMGARVIGTARGQDKLKVARDNGADHTIDYAEEDVRERVLEITDGNGADVIYDPVGGDVFDESLRYLAWRGRILIIGFAAGRIPQIPANRLLLKNCSAVGVYWGAHMKRDPALLAASLETLLAWYDQGKLKPHISHRYDLADAADALGMLTSRKATGKVVLTTGLG